MTTEYRVSVDRNACQGIFACLVRDDRFEEDEAGLATVSSTSTTTIERTDSSVVATFNDDRIDDARQAARACPVDAIAVEEVSP